MIDRERAGRILLELVKGHRVFRTADQHRQSTISGTKVGVLQALKDGDARLGELAKRLTVSASVASRTVDALESDGLVRRRPDDADARALVVSITDLGLANVTRRHRYIAEKFADVLSDWTPEEADDVIGLLDRLNTHLNQLTEALEADDRRTSAA